MLLFPVKTLRNSTITHFAQHFGGNENSSTNKAENDLIMSSVQVSFS